MDDEDMGEFGFAPQTIKAADEFSTRKKRKKQPFSTGPIPGVPVLHSLLQVHCEAIGFTLMKNMGWKVSQENEKDGDDDDEEDALQSDTGKKVYGCVIPKVFRVVATEKFIIGAASLKCKHPYDDFISNPKCNSNGMGYSGLDRSIFGHVNLLEPSKLVVREKNNKKSTIRGQAFGVGAFELEDEDIYCTDDMAKYDFSLGNAPESSRKPKAIELHKDSSSVLGEFVRAKTSFTFPCSFPMPTIPGSFTGKHKVKRSRFEPLPESQVAPEKPQVHTAETRAELLKDYREKKEQEAKKAVERNDEARKKNLEMLFKSDRFVSSTSTENFTGKTLQSAGEMISSLSSKETCTGSEEAMTSGFFNDRFVASSNAEEIVRRTETQHGTKDMRKAVEMKMFGALTRTTSSWNPSAFLCKKFNVPPPLFDGSAHKPERKRTKLLIFEYQKAKDAECDLKAGLTETKTVQEPQETIKIDDPIVKEVVAKDAVDEAVEEVLENEELDPQQNIDLFKAVFLSSSEDEKSDEEVDVEPEDGLRAFTKEISEVVLPTIVNKKIGILSNLTFTKPGSRLTDEQLSKEDHTKDKIVDGKSQVDLYGPQLPSIYDKVIFSKSCVKMDKFDNDDWFEKDDVEQSSGSSKNKSSSRDKKKKRKKDREKKKHRSKHKKKQKKNEK